MKKSIHEFAIIEKYFTKNALNRRDVKLGIGDDCALLAPPPNQLLAISTDTMVSGVHFFPNVSPKTLGHKILAINLSDLAATGATPAWATLCLTMPKANEKWLKSFCQGFFKLAKQYQVSLVGGDLTQGPLSITAQVCGFVPKQQSLRRDAAKPGDLIFVSGTLGDAGAALNMLQKKLNAPKELLQKLETPQPQIALGKKLLGIANAAIDISDGLAADLQHILDKSHVGATVFVDDLPLSKQLKSIANKTIAKHCALSAGDDYELCFTISNAKYQKHKKLLSKLNCTCIGKIEKKPGLRLKNAEGSTYHLKKLGYKHF